MRLIRTLPALIGGIALSLAPCSHAQQGDGTRVAMATAIVKPDKLAATPERVAALKAPAGFWSLRGRGCA